MIRSVRRLLALLALVAAAGCNMPGPRSPDAPEIGWLAARGYDLMDPFELNVGAGTGLHFAVAIEPIRVAYGTYREERAGMMGRAVGTWDESRSEFWIGVHTLGCWRKRPCHGNGMLFTPEVVPRRNAQRREVERMHPAFYEEWGWTTRYEDYEKHWLDVVVEVHPLFFGLDVGFSLQETVDFVLGIFGVDAVSHDDYGPEPMLDVTPFDFRPRPLDTDPIDRDSALEPLPAPAMD